MKGLKKNWVKINDALISDSEIKTFHEATVWYCNLHDAPFTTACAGCFAILMEENEQKEFAINNHFEWEKLLIDEIKQYKKMLSDIIYVYDKFKNDRNKIHKEGIKVISHIKDALKKGNKDNKRIQKVSL